MPRLAESLLDARARILVPTASDRDAWDAVDAGTSANIIARAMQDLGKEWPQASATAFARFRQDGDRSDYESRVFMRHIRLNRAVVAALASRDAVVRRKFLDEVIDGVILFCEQSTWCWPAHDVFNNRRGWATPDPEQPFLDLGAGDVLAQLGWIDHVLGEELDHHAPGLRKRIRQEAQKRCFAPFLGRKDWPWLGSGNNWIAWIPSNLIVGAITLIDDPLTRAQVIAAAILLLDEYVDVLGDDGSIDEGYLYWWRGPAMLLSALELLDQASNGELSAVDIPKVRATLRFPLNLQLDQDWYYNPADGRALAGQDQPWHLLHRWGLRTGDKQVVNHAASYRRADLDAVSEFLGNQVPPIHGALGKLLAGLSDRRWSTAATAPAPLPRDVWLPSVQIAVARQHQGSAKGLTLVVKGGHNAESHNHNDVGSVLVAVGGRPVAVDVGCPTYDAKTFSHDRYKLWMMQSSWHNVPEPRGVAQFASQTAAGSELGYGCGDQLTSVSMELAAAYDCAELQSLARTAVLDRAREEVRVADAWKFASPGEAMAIHYILSGPVSLDAAAGCARVVVPESNRTLVIEWDPGQASASVERKDVDDPVLEAVWGTFLTRLKLVATTASREGTLAVTFKISVQQ